MTVDIYAIKTGLILQTVRLDPRDIFEGRISSQLKKAETEWTRENGTLPGGVIAVPRLGSRQRYVLGVFSRSSLDEGTTQHRKAAERLVDYGFMLSRLGGNGRNAWSYYRLSGKGQYAVRALRIN